MRIRIFFLLALLFIAGCAITGEPQEQFLLLDEIPDAAELAVSANLASLPDNEKLTYEIKWIGFSVGTLTTSIKGIEKIGGRDTYVLEAEFKTNNFLSKIYPVK
ncbi:MAG: DUF3108 domain-containing protein, partial [Candidatus Omnitrophota bacterium]